jgi:hypothetical protein
MLFGVTGTPGAGKSYYAVRKIVDNLQRGKLVATNVPLCEGWEVELAKRTLGSRLIPGRVQRRAAFYRDRSMQVRTLDELMQIQLAGSDEGRGVCVLDEAHEWLNSRLWDADKELRQRYVDWFSTHRHAGWDVYLISQHLDSVDKQVRDRVEFNVRLRNMKRARLAGFPIVPMNVFLAVHTWNGGPQSKKVITKREWFLLDGRRKLYSTHRSGYELRPGRPTLPRSATPEPSASGPPAAAAPAGDTRSPRPGAGVPSGARLTVVKSPAIVRGSQ